MTIYPRILLLTLLTLLAACQRPDLDLAELSLPMAPSAILDKHTHRLDYELTDWVVYRSKDEGLLWFGGQSLSGSMLDNEDKPNAFLASNYVSFYVDKSVRQITAYEIHTETTDKTATLESTLMERLGPPDYFYRDARFSSRVWERQGRFYLFATNNTGRIMGKPFRSSDLQVVPGSNAKLLEWLCSASGFAYYGEYLTERAKPAQQGRTYRYRDFIQQAEAEAQRWGRAHSIYFERYVPS
ncbi:hypothetical protein [Chitinimonas taiwanensis]|uniref:hypothetical protein n=1 Tax=Chitinimonas taiwanensis TaxID=240412 RepID=UPI0035AF3782